MGIKEYISAGSDAIKRESVTINLSTSDQRQSGSISLGSGVAITEIQSNSKCRVRLYGDATSRSDVNEINRPFVSQSVSQSISLIVDADIDNQQIFRLTPPLFGFNLDNPVSNLLYYTIESSSGGAIGSSTSVTITKLLVEDLNISAVNNRDTLVVSASALAAGNYTTGTIQSPRSYLLYRVLPTQVPLRLRLYTRQNYRDNAAEIARPFTTEPNSGSGLIADIYMEDLVTSSMVPIVVGRNDNDENDFSITVPDQETYFTLNNVSGGLMATVSASLYVYSLED